MSTNFSLKPDIVAPGVQLATTTLGGTSALFRGTSLPAPVVAGACALLKEYRPTWSSALAKSALMEAAKGLGADIWTEGKGRLDVLKATRIAVVAVPQTLSLGLDDLSQSTCSSTDTATIFNLSDSTKSVTVQISNGLPSGIAVTASTFNIVANSNSSSQFSVTITVDNSVAQIPTSDPPAITGVVSLHAVSDSIVLPWALAIGGYVDFYVKSAPSITNVDVV